MHIELIDLGGSRSVPAGDALRQMASADACDVTLIVGGDAAGRARALGAIDLAGRQAVMVELDTECLEFHTGGGPVTVFGFARFRLGDMPPTRLVELVRPADAQPSSLTAALAVLTAAGFEVSTCADAPGRIVNRLLRPYLNSALLSVDHGLAAAADLDLALRLGLGYPKGPLESLEAEGLEAHFRISAELHQVLGEPSLLPARRAHVAAMRTKAGLGRR